MRISPKTSSEPVSERKPEAGKTFSIPPVSILLFCHIAILWILNQKKKSNTSQSPLILDCTKLEEEKSDGTNSRVMKLIAKE